MIEPLANCLYMLIIRDNQFIHEPLVDIISHGHLLHDLEDAVNEYIASHKQRAIIAGKSEDVFYVSGMAEHHHSGLADYLNATIFKNSDVEARLRQGHFADYPMIHTWIEVGDIIIDVTVKQFSDKNITLLSTLKQLLDHRYFICDNPQNCFYSLYRAMK